MYLHSDFSHRRRVHWPDKATAFSLSFLHTKLLVGGCTDRQTDRAKAKSKEKKRAQKALQQKKRGTREKVRKMERQKRKPVWQEERKQY